MQVILQVIQRTYFGENTFGNLFVIAQNLFQSISAEFHSGLQVQVFAERETTQVVTLHDVTQFQVLFFQSHHGRTGEDDFQIWETVVAHTEFPAPVRVLEHLVYQQYFSAATLEFVCEINDTEIGKVEIVHIDKETGTVGSEFLFGVLQQKRGFTYTARSFNTDEAVVPVDLIHEVTANRGIGMLNKIGVCAVECFHAVKFGLSGDKYTPFL